MNWLKRFISVKSQTLAIRNGEVFESTSIPEPTRSLLFLTDEDPENALSPTSIKINIVLTQDSAEVKTEVEHNFFGEPSLIWKKLRVQNNIFLEQQPLYFPSYISLNPEQRYQYLSWLKDVTKPTNLSYVFLYYYGLERHLLIGDFENAFREIVRLLQYHDKGSFRSYAQGVLIATVLHRQRWELFRQHEFLLEGFSNEILFVRRMLGEKITPKEIMDNSRAVGFKNRNYITKYPDEFLQELEKLVVSYEHENGSLLEVIPKEELEMSEMPLFANVSIPDHIRVIKTPQLLTNFKFRAILYSLLENAHTNVKERHSKRR